MDSPTHASTIAETAPPDADVESGYASPGDVPFVPYSSTDRYVRSVGKHVPAMGGM